MLLTVFRIVSRLNLKLIATYVHTVAVRIVFSITFLNKWIVTEADVKEELIQTVHALCDVNFIPPSECSDKDVY